ncbi:MAG: insulinase family protein [Deltaproteobacteria bacterium]|nr:insulinase family protein [Deltaproteobacteria bacterium]
MSRIKKTLLDGGIKVITEEMPDVESSTIGVWVKTGSRSEGAADKGISHFIEHLLFKGTKRRTSLDIAREIEGVGGVLNAFTGKEYTCFYAKVLNKDLPLAIDLLSDIFLNPVFDPAELEKERMVVLQEIKMVEDTPDDIIHDMLASEMWKGSSAASPVLGSAATVSAITRESVREYFLRHYAAPNVFIAAAGGIKHKNVVKYLDKAFKGFSRRSGREKFDMPVPARTVKVTEKKLEQAHFCLGVPTPSQTHPDRYKFYLLNTILGGGMSSRLFQEIREKRGLAYSVYSYLNLLNDTGALVVYAGTSPKNFAKTVELILKEFALLVKGAKKAELDSAKEQLKGGMLLGLETSDNRMTKIARDEMCFGREVPVREIVKGIDSVTTAGLKRAAASIFSPKAVTLVALGKVDSKSLPKALKR